MPKKPPYRGTDQGLTKGHKASARKRINPENYNPAIWEAMQSAGYESYAELYERLQALCAEQGLVERLLTGHAYIKFRNAALKGRSPIQKGGGPSFSAALTAIALGVDIDELYPELDIQKAGPYYEEVPLEEAQSHVHGGFEEVLADDVFGDLLTLLLSLSTLDSRERDILRRRPPLGDDRLVDLASDYYNPEGVPLTSERIRQIWENAFERLMETARDPHFLDEIERRNLWPDLLPDIEEMLGQKPKNYDARVKRRAVQRKDAWDAYRFWLYNRFPALRERIGATYKPPEPRDP